MPKELKIVPGKVYTIEELAEVEVPCTPEELLKLAIQQGGYWQPHVKMTVTDAFKKRR